MLIRSVCYDGRRLSVDQCAQQLSNGDMCYEAMPGASECVTVGFRFEMLDSALSLQAISIRESPYELILIQKLFVWHSGVFP